MCHILSKNWIQDDIVCFFQTEENGSPVLDVKASYVKDGYFRVEAGGVINDVNVAVYSKVSVFPCIVDFLVYVD